MTGAPPRSGSLPLEGIRVADFCWMIAGPATSRILADFGAEVIKIESSRRVDRIREGGVLPPADAIADSNGVFNDCNTNKLSIELNLGHPRGIELAKQLIAQSDVVTNNFTAERMDRWGLGYDALRTLKPDLVMMTMPVMGMTGPYRGYGSYGNGVIAYGGLSANMGRAGNPPVGIAPLYSDFSTPYFAASAILAAVHHRERTGQGQFIDLAQAEATVSLLGADVLNRTVNGALPQIDGNHAADFAPHDAYPCAGEDRWLAIAVTSEEQWVALCTAIDRAELAADPRFATLAARKRNETDLDATIAAWTRERDAWEAMHHLQSRGVMAAVVEDLADLVERDPHLPVYHFQELHREGETVSFTTHSQPARLDGERAALRRGPLMGEHNEYVYRELLGLSEEEYVQALIDGVIS